MLRQTPDTPRDSPGSAEGRCRCCSLPATSARAHHAAAPADARTSSQHASQIPSENLSQEPSQIPSRVSGTPGPSGGRPLSYDTSSRGRPSTGSRQPGSSSSKGHGGSSGRAGNGKDIPGSGGSSDPGSHDRRSGSSCPVCGCSLQLTGSDGGPDSQPVPRLRLIAAASQGDAPAGKPSPTQKGNSHGASALQPHLPMLHLSQLEQPATAAVGAPADGSIAASPSQGITALDGNAGGQKEAEADSMQGTAPIADSPDQPLGQGQQGGAPGAEGGTKTAEGPQVLSLELSSEGEVRKTFRSLSRSTVQSLCCSSLSGVNVTPASIVHQG